MHSVCGFLFVFVLAQYFVSSLALSRELTASLLVAVAVT
jgi:hypothetical protein